MGLAAAAGVTPVNEDPVLVKLKNVLGADKADALVDEVLAEMGLVTLGTADDRYAFGEALVKRGGLLEAIGRSIKVKALLHGASGR